MPTGPSVSVMPAPGKSFAVFQAEDVKCRQWAEQNQGTSSQQVYQSNVATGAVAGTAIGAGLGAAVGSASGHSGAGALIGGAYGLLVGTAAGSDSGSAYGRAAQRRYDNAYVQCMYSYGNQVPGYQSYAASPQQAAIPYPPEVSVDEAPQFVYSPELNLYVAVGVPYDLVYTGSMYLYFYGGRWYQGPYYDGPWAPASRRYFPRVLFRYRIDQVRHYRDMEFRRYEHDRGAL